MSSFLHSRLEIRCQKCQAAATAGNPVTVEKLLYTGWICGYCDEVHIGALMSGGEIELAHLYSDEMGVPKVVPISVKDKPKAKILDKMNRKELVAELNKWALKLKDIPVSGKTVSNEDIRKALQTQAIRKED